MNRRAFLLGAVVAPIAAPAIAAQTPAKPLPVVGRGALYIVGEGGIEYLVPSGAWTIKTPAQIAADVRRDLRGLQDRGTFSVSINPAPRREPAI